MCMHACGWGVCSCLWGTEEDIRHPETEVKAVVSKYIWVLGAEIRSLTRVLCVLSC